MTIDDSRFNLNFGALNPYTGLSFSGFSDNVETTEPLFNFAQTDNEALGFTVSDFMPDISLCPSLGPLSSIDMNTFSLMNMFLNFKMPDFSQFAINLPSFTMDFNTDTSTLNSNSSIKKSVRMTGNMGNDIVSTAQQYIGLNEKDGSYKRFTNGRTEAWCADFVSYVVKEAYTKNGKTIPSGFGSPSVSNLRQWGINNGCYLETANRTDKANCIKQNVKPGDVVIFKEGRSHTGIVKEVKSDGTIVAIEGNTSDQVACRTYKPGEGGISGFIQIA